MFHSITKHAFPAMLKLVKCQTSPTDKPVTILLGQQVLEKMLSPRLLNNTQGRTGCVHKKQEAECEVTENRRSDAGGRRKKTQKRRR